MVFSVDEPIFGLPTTELNENEANYIGVSSIEMVLQYGDLQNIINVHCVAGGVDKVLTFSPGVNALAGTATSTVLADNSALVLKYMSLHPSQYAKLSKRNVINFDEFTNTPTTLIRSANPDTFPINSNEISTNQIADKIYVSVKPQPFSQSPKFSNNLCFPIHGLNIKYNGVAGLLSDRTMADLYVMSRRNGSNQTWAEFSGIVKINNAAGAQVDALSIGSIVVIDPVRDLGLSDLLSASSLGSFSMQINVTVGKMFGVDHNAMPSVELSIIQNTAGVMIIEKGVSQLLSGLLTKESVLKTKAKGSSNIDYEDVEKIAGGSVMKQGKSVVGKLFKSERSRVARGMDGQVDKGVDYGAAKAKDYAHDKLSKYM
jgi:hypothetical protein